VTRSPFTRDIDGFLLVDKPARIGSTAVLQHVRRLYGAIRAGHTGTLDPMASGLLVLCFGEATKFAGELLDATKSYRASVLLGVTTETGDAEGAVLERREAHVSRDEVESVLERFRGEILQTPPMHSALKRDGKPLYVYARRGETVERAPRQVTIHALELEGFAPDCLEITVTCSKGTYIRTLAEDLGRAFGCGAHLGGLVRTALGRFGLDDAHTPDALAALSEEPRERLLLATDELLTAYPDVVLPAGDDRRFRQGQAIAASSAGHGLVRVYGEDHAFLGTGWAEAGGLLRPRRLVKEPVVLLRSS
jgi:tRNA pseudouridine55 synthase